MKNRNLLMIPGPIEFEPAVLAAMGAPTTSHVAPNFIETFGQALERMRQVFLAPDGQPFIIAGTGTLAMDTTAANLVETGDQVLVVNTGYFGDRMGDILTRYGARVTHVRAPVGDRPLLEDVETALSAGQFKAVFVTHVDTSTAVLTNVQALAALAHKYHAMIAVDGVCSVAGEELYMTDWDVDLAFTASQKAVGVPPGLALLVARPRALKAFHSRKTPVGSYYSDWTNWLPIMEAYEARKGAYFATPAVNLVWALNVSLGQILAEGMNARFARHALLSRAFKAGIGALGLGQVPVRPEAAANTLTAPRFPAGVSGADFLARVGKAGVTLAGGLHAAIKSEYFRVGHMGAVSAGDVLAVLGAVETALHGCGYVFEAGAGVAAAQALISA
ncbi:MAG TPA: alanine--glyoxylate aminotransferase family protein [Anaerolineaceae bacterium]|nr:alanine--glyoxylate aminotransferase family protein [Anaerolineaceae bacterium]HPA32110.1 alanine--glyoxylate aminotransferase family protein [Anaerolineaceae bacterium]HQL38391.1 alanine--glyoxylate aminotransferase family protein [Anaerolineaceae bacterium]HQO97022.1 alanine--glyoxylate aminotransferase family protein [Anaerolineaceae bacterium]HQP61354.1 alanine--glyoxylate aminotransferase family protein [Anaerolineaceae bacterium]